jgi:allophanate hydrolase
MTTATLNVVQVGPLVSLQDRGRAGHMRFGVPASGPMDRYAFAIAQIASGQARSSAGIEVSMGGLTLDCREGAVTFAIAGGGFQVALDGIQLSPWCVATIEAGSRLTIRPGAWGSWTYLVFAGDLQATRWLGSMATHSQSGLGGGIVTVGQRLRIDNAEVREHFHGEIPRPQRSPPPVTMRVVLGPQDRFFSADTIRTFLAEPYALTDAYDRMGVRLAGPPLQPCARLDMPSEAIARGSVQVAGDGVATVLLADHQTTGGYPKIATVIAGDLDHLVQLRSGDKVAFASITAAAALEEARRRSTDREAFLAGLHHRAGSLSERLLSLNLIDGVVSGAS